jgi:hypothetical protein
MAFMTRHTFQAICQSLWGPQYQSEAARQLGISRRSMVRYDQGERPVPDPVAERLNKLADERCKQLAKLSSRGQ